MVVVVEEEEEEGSNELPGNTPMSPQIANVVGCFGAGSDVNQAVGDQAVESFRYFTRYLSTQKSNIPLSPNRKGQFSIKERRLGRQAQARD